MAERHVHALLVTALSLERIAVRSHLDSIESRTVGPAAIDVGRFEASGTPLGVAIIEVGPGNIDASALTTIVASELAPRVTLMVGIAGGIKDVRLGDVVASSKVYWGESGKSNEESVLTRPGLGHVSPVLVQRARQVVADDRWQERITQPEATGPSALVAPIIAGERVVASSRSADAERIKQNFSDAVAVAMEEFGVLRAADLAGGGEAIAIRGVSDLLDGKSSADAGGSQPRAASHAAAFAFELLTVCDFLTEPSAEALPEGFYRTAATLYPSGPTDRHVWQRAGGDVSALELTGTGQSMWWSALRQLKLGGGGLISAAGLLTVMQDDFPDNDDLALP